MTHPPTLNYAPPGRRRINWRVLKWLVMGIAVLVGLWYLPQGYRWTKDRAELFSLMRTCRTFSPPAGAVVYDDTADAEKMAELPPYDPFMSTSWRDDDGIAQLAYRRHLLALDRLRPPSIVVWESSSSARFATVFCHERRTRGGDPCTVAVLLHADRSNAQSSSTSSMMTFEAQAIRPVGWFTPASPEIQSTKLTLAPWPVSTQRVRIYAGQPAPADPARFTIDYEVNDTPGIIDGVLNDDFTVTLTSRTGALAASPTSQETR